VRALGRRSDRRRLDKIERCGKESLLGRKNAPTPVERRICAKQMHKARVDGADLGRSRFAGNSERRDLFCAYFSACAGITPVAKATAAAWVRFMQCNLWRAASRCVLTLPNAKPKISAISW
jgi:hypothetical protein